jgi:vacuolar-type H+-ATPase subunit I/STV1
MTLDQEAEIYGMERRYCESDQDFEARIENTCATGQYITYPTPADQCDTDCNEPPSLRDYPIILVLWIGMIFMAMGVALHALYVYLRDALTDNIDIVAVSFLVVGLLVFAAAIGLNCHN